MKIETTFFSVRLPKHLKIRLDRFAEKIGQTKTYCARKAIEYFLDEKEGDLFADSVLEQENPSIPLEDFSIKKFHTYALYDGKEKIYIGKTNDLKKQKIIHKKEGKKFTRVEKTSKVMNEESALRREFEQLGKYRYGHKGKNPRDNETVIK